jgi:hypothetical protein
MTGITAMSTQRVLWQVIRNPSLVAVLLYRFQKTPKLGAYDSLRAAICKRLLQALSDVQAAVVNV